MFNAYVSLFSSNNRVCYLFILTFVFQADQWIVSQMDLFPTTSSVSQFEQWMGKCNSSALRTQWLPINTDIKVHSFLLREPWMLPLAPKTCHVFRSRHLLRNATTFPPLFSVKMWTIFSFYGNVISRGPIRRCHSISGRYMNVVAFLNILTRKHRRLIEQEEGSAVLAINEGLQMSFVTCQLNLKSVEGFLPNLCTNPLRPYQTYEQALVGRDATTWKLWGEFRRFERRLFVWSY
jgi:hypothetical protein